VPQGELLSEARLNKKIPNGRWCSTGRSGEVMLKP
jgi:hypothetical protein